MLEKPGEHPPRKVGAERLGTWLPAGIKRGAQALSPGGGEGHKERLFAQ